MNILFRELKSALKWDRPSILLAIYSSELVRAEAEDALQTRLAELNQSVTHFQVSEDKYDIPLLLSEYPNRNQMVFFVSGLRWGGGTDGRNTYRALNIRREYFVDFRIRVVFWLTENEAAGLPTHAPDFWAFRHRVVEFVEAPSAERIIPVARQLAWRDFEDRTLREDADAKIALRRALLEDIPKNKATMAARADLLFTLGGLYWAKDEYDLSVKDVKQALRLAERLGDPILQSWCYNGLGNTYANLGRTDEAVAYYQKAIELNPKFALPQNGLGNIYGDLGRMDDALATYLKAIELDPKSGYPRNGLGNVYRALGRTDEAIAAYQKAIELDPKSGYPWNGLGNTYRALGRKDEAIAAYQKAIELDPKFAYPWNGLGNTYDDLGRTDDALATYLKSIELDPKYGYPWNGLGNVYRALGRTDEAIAAYQKAIELDPKDDAPHTGLAGIYNSMDEYEKAIHEYKSAIKLDKDDKNRAIDFNSLGNTYRALGRKDEAITAYNKAIELNPKEAIYQHNLGVACTVNKEYTRALEAHQKAVELAPNDGMIRSSLVGILHRLGREAESAEQIGFARPLMEKENEYNRACFESICGNVEEALRLLKIALEKKQTSLAWARRDPDFDFIRDNPRFQELVGEEGGKNGTGSS